MDRKELMQSILANPPMPPNYQAESADRLADIYTTLMVMGEAQSKESRKQARRFRWEIGLIAITAGVAVAGLLLAIFG